MKDCKRCNKTLPKGDFFRRAAAPDKLTPWCKKCHKEYAKDYYEKNRVVINEKNRTWYNANQDSLRQYRAKHAARAIARSRSWYHNNKERAKASVSLRYKERLANDPTYAFKYKLRWELRLLLTKKYMCKNILSALQCTREELMHHLESKFSDGMNWGNYGEWQIDHIIPLKIAKDIDTVRKLNHYLNLQPLWKSDNIKKGAKLC